MNHAYRPLLLLLALTVPARAQTPEPLSPADLAGLVQAHADSVFAEMVQIRRDLHRHPERSGEEARTAQVVADHLRSWGLEVRTGVGGHGVVGTLRGRPGAPVVAYRADMDAVSMDLTEQVDYRSTVPGLAHGCGHDMHTTIGLGVARVLASLRGRFDGTVVFIFQPAEETGQGARRMIAEGVLDDPAPGAIFAVHMAPMPVGTITTTPGTGLPGVEVFTIHLGDGSEPAAAARELAASIRSHHNLELANLDAILGGMFQPDNPVLSNFVMAFAECRTEGDAQVVSGMVRAARESDQTRVLNDLQAKLRELEGRGLTTRVETAMSLPAMTSDPELGVWAMGPLASILGQRAVLRVYHAIPTNSEDFAHFLQKTPGVMFWLGGSDEANGVMALPHAPTFAVDERALGVGIKGLSQVLIQRLADAAR